MRASSAIVADLLAASSEPASSSISARAGLTSELVRAVGDEGALEYRRFLTVRHRDLEVYDTVRHEFRGKRVLVTGGTGCIGRELMRQLVEAGAGAVASVARRRRLIGVDAQAYSVDVADRRATMEAVADFGPDVVFHLAAQRDPGLAEQIPLRTYRTNVVGARNVAAICADRRIPLVHASTGKAMRYVSSDVYATSKKLSELALSGTDHSPISVARFTHVVDNSLLHSSLVRRLRTPGSEIVVHAPDINFYVQSAKESALLLMSMHLEGSRYTRFGAIRDLEQPVDLLLMTVGMLRTRLSDRSIRIERPLSGYEDGYFSGLFDPATAGDVSPLLNAVEARSAFPSGHSDNVDVFSTQSEPAARSVDFAVLDEAIDARDELAVRSEIERLRTVQLEMVFRAAGEELLRRLLALADRVPHASRLQSMQVDAMRAVLASSRWTVERTG